MYLKRFFIFALAVMAACTVRGEILKAHHEKSLAPKPGGTLKIDAQFQSITVAISSEAKQIDVVVDLEASLWPGDVKAYVENLAPVFKEKGDVITITSKANGRWTSGENRSSGKISLVMPPGMALDLKTGSGSIKIMGDTGGKPVTCDTGSGGVVVEGTASALNLEAGSGVVCVTLPEGHTPVGTLATRSGKIECDFPGTYDKDKKICTLAGGAGATTLKIQTGSGSIAVTKPKAQPA